MPSAQQKAEKAAQDAFREEGDLAVYVVPVRDTPNGMDGWTEVPEADPVQFVRANEDGHEGFLLVRVSPDHLCHANRPEEISIQEVPSA